MNNSKFELEPQLGHINPNSKIVVASNLQLTNLFVLKNCEN